MSEEMKKMRAQMEEDEQVASLMRGLRGQNLSDELFASADTRLRLVEVGSLNMMAFFFRSISGSIPRVGNDEGGLGFGNWKSSV